MIDQKSERGVGGRRINIFPCQVVGGEFESESFEIRIHISCYK